MEAQNLAKFAFYHSAERVVRSGAILHRGPKSPFCHSPERVVRFFVAGAALWSQLVFFPHRGACSISGLRNYTLKMLWNTRKIGSLCSTVFSWRTQLHDGITSCFQVFLDNLWFDFERCSYHLKIILFILLIFIWFDFGQLHSTSLPMAGPKHAILRTSLPMAGPHHQIRRTSLPMAGPKPSNSPDLTAYGRTVRQTYVRTAGPSCLWPDRTPALGLTKLVNGGRGCSRRKHGYRKQSGTRILLPFHLPLALYARVLSKPGEMCIPCL